MDHPIVLPWSVVSEQKAESLQQSNSTNTNSITDWLQLLLLLLLQPKITSHQLTWSYYESLTRFVKLSKPEKLGTRRSSTNLWTWDNLPSTTGQVLSSRGASKSQTHNKRGANLLHRQATSSPHGVSNTLSISTLTKTKNKHYPTKKLTKRYKSEASTSFAAMENHSHMNFSCLFLSHRSI